MIDSNTNPNINQPFVPIPVQGATRAVRGNPRKALLMIPLFDMANHYDDCPVYLSKFNDRCGNFTQDFVYGGEVVHTQGFISTQRTAKAANCCSYLLQNSENAFE